MIPSIETIMQGLRDGTMRIDEAVSWLKFYADEEKQIKHQERKALFQKVCLKLDLQDLQLKVTKNERKDFISLPEFTEPCLRYANHLTEAILTASEEFATKGDK